MKRLSILWIYLRTMIALFGSHSIPGDHLKPEMTVCCVWSSGLCSLHLHGHPLTVKAVNYPFVAFEMERPVMNVQHMVEGKPMETKRTIVTVNVIGSRFVVADKEYAEAALQKADDNEFPSTTYLEA